MHIRLQKKGFSVLKCILGHTMYPLCKLYLILQKENFFNSFKQLQVKFVYNEVQIKVCSF